MINFHRALDISLTAAAFIAAYFIKKYLLPTPFVGLTIAPNYYIVLLTVVIIWYLTFNSFDLYASYRRRGFGEILMNMVKAVATAMLVLVLFMYILKIKDVSRIMLGLFFILDIALLGLSKGSVYYLLRRPRRNGYNYRNLLVIGSKARAKDVINTIGDQSESGFRVIGCLEADPGDVGKEAANGIRVIGTLDKIEGLLRDEVVDGLIVAMPLNKVENAGEYLQIAVDMGVSVRIMPDWQIKPLTYRQGIAAFRLEDFWGIPTMTLQTTPPNYAALLMKSIFDYVAAFVGLILLMPFLALIAAAIKLSSEGPVLFTQERSGLNGRRFKFYKFRTMVAGAEAMQDRINHLNESDGPVFKIRKDPRIIPYIGAFLRRTGLDELPQLINVLKGEMSIVGPRPPIPAEVVKYDRWQMRRLSMKPGLTCIWQTSLHRNDISFDEWMKLDLKYIDNWSLWLDMKLLLKTVKVVFLGDGR